LQSEVVGCDRSARPKVAAVIVGPLVPFVIFDDCCGGCGLGAIAAPSSTPAANAIPERPTTARAVVNRCVE
jgi:hypothetical protein